MKLFRVHSGWGGLPYEVCYVWAENDADATELAYKQYVAQFKCGYLYENSMVDGRRLEAELLFDSDESPFCTAYATEGWTTDNAVQSPSIKAQ